MVSFFDNHYDLLTEIAINFDPFNKNSNINNLTDKINKMYNDNIKGSIINLFFMSKEEMKDELDIKDINVIEMFKKSKEQLEFMKMAGYIKDDVKFIYSIEGCDFLEIDDLEKLYNLGLRSILPVWNNKNKYGSGINTNESLTEEGKKLIKRAVELGIIIDLSHMNEKTFFETLDYIIELKKENYNPIVISSHSNLKVFNDVDRNISDKQIKTMKYLDVYLGLILSSKFIDKNYLNMSNDERKKKFLDMLEYVINDLEYPIDKIILSTDDMNYHPDSKYHNYNLFDLDNISEELYKTLKTRFNEEIVSKIMFENSMNIYDKVKENNKKITL